jgi:preprotein translocase subunit YajC
MGDFVKYLTNSKVLSSLYFLLVPNLAFAQATTMPAGEPSLIQRLVAMAPMIAIIFGIFYIMVILPKKLIEGLKKGEEIVTVSGIIGKVSAVEADAVILEVAQNTKMRFEKNAVRKKVANS